MGLISAVHSELIKTKHTPFAALHIVVPLIGTLLFKLYYSLYVNVAECEKLNLILEITNTIFPLLISVVVGLNVVSEEKASHFQTLLAVRSRSKLFLAKLTTLYGTGLTSLFFMFALFGFGISFMKLTSGIPLNVFIQAVIGLAFCNLVLYIFHLFLSLKYGLGISLLWGAFECLQNILYSNIELRGIWRYIPFAWSINWIHDTLNNRLADYAAQWELIAILTVCILLLIMTWFSYWEGRKNYE